MFSDTNHLNAAFRGFPLPEKNSVNFIFPAKIVSRFAASPRGEAPPGGGGEGRRLFSDTNHLNAAFLGFPLPEKNSANFIFFGKNCQPLRGFPFGEALPRSGGGEVRLKFPSSLPLNP